MVACFAIPYLTDVTENAQFMSGFVGGWRNNDSFFGLLLYLTGDLYRAKYLAFTLLFGSDTLARFEKLASWNAWLSGQSWPCSCCPQIAIRGT